MSSSGRRFIGYRWGTDRISNLPNSIIDNILDRLPIVDAVRTSILSTQWRHHWTRVGNLVFDNKFIEDGIVGQQNLKLHRLNSKFIEAVSTFLLLHNGPIHKFVLHVPRFRADARLNANASKWIHAVSQRDVTDITLDVDGLTCLLPSIIFDCVEVRRLALHNCRYGLPDNLKGFSNLITLQLHQVMIVDDELNDLISNFPSLENFSIETYAGPLNVNAPKLKTLSVTACDFTVFTLPVVQDLVAFSFTEVLWAPESPEESYNIIQFFAMMPKIESVTLTSVILGVFAEQHIPEKLPSPITCLQNLTLLDFDVASLKDLSCALCILRSSLYLETLSFSMALISYVEDEEEADALGILQEQFGEWENLSCLLTIKLKRLSGTQPQITFLKFLLSACPALKSIHVNSDKEISEQDEVNMISELVECPRSSSEAQIWFSKGSGNAFDSYSNGPIDSFIYELVEYKRP